MNFLYHDFETRSEADLPTVELDNYAKHPSTKALMLSWAIDDETVHLWFPSKEPMPVRLKDALLSPTFFKVAWNAAFERNIWKHVLGFDVPIEEWIDPSVMARSLSMPGKLVEVGSVLGLPEDQAKMKEGKKLIKLFSIPKPIKKKRKLEDWEQFFGAEPVKPSFNDEMSHPEEWKIFSLYCIRDTEAERTIFKMLSSLPMCDLDREGWILDQVINDRGIPTNRQFAKNALAMGLRDQAEQRETMEKMTGLENPNSIQQLLPWVKERGYPFDSLLKKLVQGVLKIVGPEVTPDAREVLRLRLESGKNSFKKFEAILDQLSEDDRLRRQFLFLGAGRTGRWSGQGIQPHNLPRPSIKNIDKALELVGVNDWDGLKEYLKTEAKAGQLPPSVIDAVSSLIRAAFQASEGKTFVVGDLNAIENRVLGYVCNEPAIQKVFDDGRDPYLDFASKRFNIPYETLEANYNGYKLALKEHREPTPEQQDAADKRQAMKPAVLGAGFGLGGGKEVRDKKTGELKKTGLWGYAWGMGIKLTQDESKDAVDAFREAYPGVPLFWREIERACMNAIVLNRKTRVGVVVVSSVTRKNGQKILRIQLPSGRFLTYINARIETRVINSTQLDEDGEEIESSYEKETIAYDGIGHGVAAVEGVTHWGKVYTYGGKFTENIVQAISRDLLLYAMILASKIMDIVLHVHDEIGAEVPKESAPEMLKLLLKCMSTTPPWAPGLKLGAEGYISDYYKKG